MAEKNKEDFDKLLNALLRYATELPSPRIRVGKQVFRMSDIFEKAYADRGFAEQLMQYPEILNLEFFGKGYLGEGIAAHYPDLALEKIIENEKVRESLDYPLPAKMAVAVVEAKEEYAKIIIEKHPDLLDLVDRIMDVDYETEYTVGETIWILYPNLRQLLEERGVKPVQMKKS
ncbi:MAG: hypothetical protein M1360_03755 [Candidatus Marsarchaeota archaeon]|jgi:hypothetical protein|nr:hypothetical protein [Candidatus Marsarchaeota archaeon]MCL5419027.1 hypothetical protein [Candidatus Marsarchaeota archaeon]